MSHPMRLLLCLLGLFTARSQDTPGPGVHLNQPARGLGIVAGLARRNGHVTTRLERGRSLAGRDGHITTIGSVAVSSGRRCSVQRASP